MKMLNFKSTEFDESTIRIADGLDMYLLCNREDDPFYIYSLPE